MTQRAAVIGMGLIGGSIAGALRAAGYSVTGFDSSPARSEIALKRELIDERAGELSGLLAGADLVILAVPVRAIVQLLPMVDALAPSEALLIDTGSVKGTVVGAMEMLPGAQRAVGGHPLAGDERSGTEAANRTLFHDRTFVLCPSKASSRDAIQRAETMAGEIGALPLVTPADRHDRVLARTSHLPQFLATTLALGIEPDDRELSGPALRDMTRLAGSESSMWRDIAVANRLHIREAIRAFQDRLDVLSQAIDATDMARIEDILERGAISAGVLSSAEASR
ncbi:MAG: prephenate dehydrogenase [Chloroflexota bacterium]